MQNVVRQGRLYTPKYPTPGCAKPSKSALYMGVSSYLAGFDIRSIKTHQERRLMSCLVHQKATTSHYKPTLPVATLCTQYPPREGVKTSKPAPYMGVR